MLSLKPLFLAVTCALAAAPPKAPIPPPPLEAGETLALAGPDGEVHVWGDNRVLPMGSLAKLVWLKLEGAEWNSQMVQFKCTGAGGGVVCSGQHGKVDLARALAENCSLAFVYWARGSAMGWVKDYGDGAARARLEDTFNPFLGNRMPPGDELPLLDGNWVGDGPLLRTSPEAMLRWLLDPAQDEVVRRIRRMVLSFVDETFKDNVWWVHVGPAPGFPDGAGSAWAVGSNGRLTAVLHLPAGKGRKEALARFQALLMVPAKPAKQ